MHPGESAGGAAVGLLVPFAERRQSFGSGQTPGLPSQRVCRDGTRSRLDCKRNSCSCREEFKGEQFCASKGGQVQESRPFWGP